MIAKYALSDEQALLAKLRYNRLIDVFTGVACYSLQSHLRTAVPQLGQVETDEVYVGIDKRGAQYVFPVQAKGRRDTQSIVQIEQDFAVCAHKFPNLTCRAIAAQFIAGSLIALFAFEENTDGVASSQRTIIAWCPRTMSAQTTLKSTGIEQCNTALCARRADGRAVSRFDEIRLPRCPAPTLLIVFEKLRPQYAVRPKAPRIGHVLAKNKKGERAR